MAARGKLSHRYAKAFFDYLKGGTEVKKTAEELASFAKLVASHPELSRVLGSEAFSSEVREGIVTGVAKKLKVSESGSRFLRVVTSQGRIRFLADIADQMHLLALASEGVVPLRVQTPKELTKPQQTKIEQKFSKLLGKEVEARYELDSDLIAGLRVEAAGRTYEGSVAGWLNELEEALAGT